MQKFELSRLPISCQYKICSQEMKKKYSAYSQSVKKCVSVIFHFIGAGKVKTSYFCKE